LFAQFQWKGILKPLFDKLKTVKYYPLSKPSDWPELAWVDIGTKQEDFTPAVNQT
jgi:hypothetical protein